MGLFPGEITALKAARFDVYDLDHNGVLEGAERQDLYDEYVAGVDAFADEILARTTALADVARARMVNVDKPFTLAGASLDDLTSENYLNTDTDADGLPDSWELHYFGDLTTSDGTGDFDGDGLNDYYEYLAGTNPTNPQTVPGMDDAALDSDGDGLSNGEEQAWGTHPGLKDSDDDGVSDGDEVYGLAWPGPERNAEYLSHPLYSMAHYNVGIMDVVHDGEHLQLTPARSLDIAAAAAAPGFAGIRLPKMERFLGLVNGVTLETWFKLGTVEADSRVIMAAMNGATPVLELGYEPDGGGDAYLYARFVGIDNQTVKVGGVGRNTMVRAGEWTHVAAVWAPAADDMASNLRL